MTTDKEFFIKCLTEGIPVYGAKNGLEFNFVESLNGYLQKFGSHEFFCYIGDEGNTIFFEVRANIPIIGLSVKEEYLMFFQEDQSLMKHITENEKKVLGEITLKVVAFVSAWNKKVMGIENKDEYNSISRMKEKYKVDDLIEKYKKNANKKDKDYYDLPKK
tara:strand:+ start:654 stop:1136 length:483 start_codon:yes stop_codon:yes gene_type:complete